MAASDATNTDTELSRFRTLLPYEQRAVILRGQGRSYEQISINLMDDFEHAIKPDSIRVWFAPGGRLEQANMEYNETLAHAALEEGKKLAMRFSKEAITTMASLLTSPDDNIKLSAAKALANKYIPDRQLTLTSPSSQEDLPDELVAKGNKLLEEKKNGTSSRKPRAKSKQRGRAKSTPTDKS